MFYHCYKQIISVEVWKTWKMQCGKCGVWELHREFQFAISIFHPHAEKPCGRTTGMLTNSKKCDASLHF